MKLLLIQPPIEDFYETDIRLQPIGLCYLKAAVQKALPDVNVRILDFHQGWGRKTIPLPKELHYLRPYYPVPDKSPFSAFHAYFRFGADDETIVHTVLGENPDIVGISSLFSPYYREVIRIAEGIKRKNKQISILLGGSHVSAMPEQMLSFEAVDFIIRGEGERPLVEFLKAWRSNSGFSRVPNLGFKTSEGRVMNAMEDNDPVDEIPIPDISDLPLAHYQYEKKPLSFVITSRSCPHRCSFCSVHKTFGTNYRRRSVESVLLEIQTRYTQGVRVFDFEDDNLTFYIGEMKKLCRRLIDLFPNRDVEFLAMNGISYLSLDVELLGLMRQAGFTHLNIALVTSDIAVRETTKRPHTVQKYEEVVCEAFRLGFEIVSYQILGLPQETLESMIQTLCFAARLPVLLGASLFYLTPQSPIAAGFPAPAEEDIFKSRLTAMAIETLNFKRSDIYTLFLVTRILNFLKGLKLSENEVCLETFWNGSDDWDYRTREGIRILKRLLEQGEFCASSPAGDVVVEPFNTGLFFRVWNQLGWLTTQEGKKLLLQTAFDEKCAANFSIPSKKTSGFGSKLITP